MFLSRKVYDEIGLFDLQYCWFFIKMFYNKDITSYLVYKVITNFTLSGMSIN